MIEPGIVVDVDLASVVFAILDEGDEETPTMGQDDIMKSDTDSDVSNRTWRIGKSSR